MSVVAAIGGWTWRKFRQVCSNMFVALDPVVGLAPLSDLFQFGQFGPLLNSANCLEPSGFFLSYPSGFRSLAILSVPNHVITYDLCSVVPSVPPFLLSDQTVPGSSSCKVIWIVSLEIASAAT